MITFLDGPAAGITLALKRIPTLLRVVRSAKGEWDALDQLEDTPKPREGIYIYRRRDEPKPTKYHVLMRNRRESGWYWTANYSFIADQPADHQVRGTEAWRDWATLNADG